MSRINAIYVRVSTDGQQTGMESQIRAVKEWAGSFPPAQTPAE